jgi:nicotinate phosphoribosyltransferase
VAHFGLALRWYFTRLEGVLTSSALLTDRYELTMLQAARHSGKADRPSVFEVFCRSLPGGRRYGVVAGTGRLLERIRDFRFEETELEYLLANQIVDAATIDWLANYKFEGNIWGYREGELYFAYSPVLTVEATFEQAVVLETIILSVLNFDSAVASAASRMVSSAGGRFLAEMGGRRTNEISAVAAARAAYIAGFEATSNLEAGRSWGIPTMGTAAHAFTLLHDTEEQAFRAQVETFGPGTTLLVDTYDTDRAVRLAVDVAGPELGAVRIDSGDLGVEVSRVRALLDSLGATKTKITVTNDLNEYSIAALAAAPVDNYGVGTSVVTGSGVPTASFVYKLVAFEDEGGDWVSVAKRSVQKANVGGRKFAMRRHNDAGLATAELLAPGAHPDVTELDRELLVPLVIEGELQSEHMGIAGVANARAHHAEVKKTLPLQALRLMRGEAGIPTQFI